MTKPRLPSAADLVNDLVENTHLLSHPECPFSFHSEAGNGKVVVLAGDNATGKSLLVSMMASRAYHDHGVEPMTVSMVARTQSGMLRAFTYGSEDYRATSEVSMGVALKALKHMPTRLEETGNAMVILDEPDVGLAEVYAYAFGQKVGQAVNALPVKAKWNLVVVSHSREMIRGLADTLERAPTFVHTDIPMTLDDWCANKTRRSTQELDDMLARASNQISQVRKVLEDRIEDDKPKKRPLKR